MGECKTHWDSDNYNRFCDTHDRSYNLCIIEERDSLRLQVDEFRKLLKQWMETSDEAQDITFAHIYKRTKFSLNTEKPKSEGQIMHAPGCIGYFCNCKPVFGEKRKCECPTLPHREGCDFRKRVAEVKGKYKDGPSPICAACGRGPFEPEYIDADGLCADCAREIDGGIA